MEIIVVLNLTNLNVFINYYIEKLQDCTKLRWLLQYSMQLFYVLYYGQCIIGIAFYVLFLHALYSLNFMLYIVLYALYSMLYILCSASYALNSMHFIPRIVLFVSFLFIVLYASYSMHPLYASHSMHCILYNIF